jgi:AhpD family alkylhydroperoxidase
MTGNRMNLALVARAPYEAMLAVERSIDLEPPLRGLVKVRASQINGCAFCIDMHCKDARASGESEERCSPAAPASPLVVPGRRAVCRDVHRGYVDAGQSDRPRHELVAHAGWVSR